MGRLGGNLETFTIGPNTKRMNLSLAGFYVIPLSTGGAGGAKFTDTAVSWNQQAANHS